MAVKPEALPSVDNDLTIPVEPPPRPNLAALRSSPHVPDETVRANSRAIGEKWGASTRIPTPPPTTPLESLRIDVPDYLARELRVKCAEMKVGEPYGGPSRPLRVVNVCELKLVVGLGTFLRLTHSNLLGIPLNFTMYVRPKRKARPEVGLVRRQCRRSLRCLDGTTGVAPPRIVDARTALPPEVSIRSAAIPRPGRDDGCVAGISGGIARRRPGARAIAPRLEESAEHDEA
jgi:hypothetical protein